MLCLNGGEDLVGRKCEVYWVLDETWYPGVIDCYDRETGVHGVVYEDGTNEILLLAQERVRLPLDDRPEIGPTPILTMRSVRRLARQGGVVKLRYFEKWYDPPHPYRSILQPSNVTHGQLVQTYHSDSDQDDEEEGNNVPPKRSSRPRVLKRSGVANPTKPGMGGRARNRAAPRKNVSRESKTGQRESNSFPNQEQFLDASGGHKGVIVLDTTKVQCTFCGAVCHPKGFGPHVASCRLRHDKDLSVGADPTHVCFCGFVTYNPAGWIVHRRFCEMERENEIVVQERYRTFVPQDDHLKSGTKPKLCVDFIPPRRNSHSPVSRLPKRQRTGYSVTSTRSRSTDSTMSDDSIDMDGPELVNAKVRNKSIKSEPADVGQTHTEVMRLMNQSKARSRSSDNSFRFLRPIKKKIKRSSF
jgi:hypothetical protein